MSAAGRICKPAFFSDNSINKSYKKKQKYLLRRMGLSLQLFAQTEYESFILKVQRKKVIS